MAANHYMTKQTVSLDKNELTITTLVFLHREFFIILITVSNYTKLLIKGKSVKLLLFKPYYIYIGLVFVPNSIFTNVV